MATEEIVRTTLPVIGPWGGKAHAVMNAAGGPGDGSLHGFYTLCGREIDGARPWDERLDGIVTCGTCLRALRPEDIDTGPLPGARLFPEDIRRAVAEGPLFDAARRTQVAGATVTVRVNGDGRCVAQELLRRTPAGFRYPSYEHERLIHELIERNDRGDYADRDRLRRDLLGAG